MSSSADTDARSKDDFALRYTRTAIPERFKDGDDADEDVTAPKTRRGRYMNQSLISVIASAGTNTSFGFRNASGQQQQQQQHSAAAAAAAATTSQGSSRPRQPSRPDRLFLSQITETDTRHRTGRRPSPPSPADQMTSSQFLPPRREETARPAPDINLPSAPAALQHLDASAESMDGQAEKADSNDEDYNDDGADDHKRSDEDDNDQLEPDESISGPASAPTTATVASTKTKFAERLAQVFGISAEEEIVATYPCWLLQNVMLQGHMYITNKHMLFYAYLPNRLNTISKSGYLSKRGRQNPKYHRYWFVLKGDVLSYYTNPSVLYFPRDTIDLRSSISAEVDKPARSSDESVSFTITALDQAYHFRADSHESAAQWVKQIQRTIFRIRNEGDSVKISIPVNNVLDIDDYPFSDFADTFRIKVIDNDESYALDEYFFAFFGGGDQALSTLRKTVESSLGRKQATALLESVQHDEGCDPAELTEPRSTAGGPNTKTSSSAPPGNSTASAQEATPSKDSKGAAGKGTLVSSASFSRLPDLLKAGSAHLSKATNIAGMLRDHSKRMGSILASESIGYYERVSTMWAGKRTHYDYSDALLSDDLLLDVKEDEKDGNHNERFRAHFALPESERLHATFYAHLNRMVPVYGKIYIGTRKACFRSLLPGSRTKMILPMREIENVNQEKGFRFGYSGLVIVVRGHEELFFEFAKAEARDDCAITLLHSIESGDNLGDSPVLSPEDNFLQETAQAESELTRDIANNGGFSLDVASSYLNKSASQSSHGPIVFDDPLSSIISFKPAKPLKITCLTIGSRGDVQPYIALGKALIEHGHSVRIATHAEFGDWIKHHGIEFYPIAGDPGEIMQLCVENDMFTVAFLREAHSKFRGWIEELLHSSWAACQGSDLLIESPSAMAGIHIAEALEIPYFRAFTMPWTRTRAYPHAFTVPTQKLGGNYNSLSYVMFENVFWQAIAGQINRWRSRTLGLPGTNLDQMQTNKVPFLYNFSPSVVVPPLDFNSWVRITGYWFLDEGEEYTPPRELAAFIAKARKDKKKLVYVGFGSMVVEDPAALTLTVVESVVKADVRCILSKGWSDRLNKGDASKPEIPLPDCIHQIKSAPHDWLFRQIDAAAHHGGAGTTGASLRAGIPTVVKPFFGDQFFFGSRVEDLGVGRLIRKINRSVFSRALWEVTNNQRIISRAQLLGERIRNENGVQTAIEAIYRDLDYARSLVKRRKKVDIYAAKKTAAEAEGFGDVEDAEGVGEEAEPEESWTLIDDDWEANETGRFDPENPEFNSTLQQRHLQQKQQRQHHHPHHHHHSHHHPRHQKQDPQKQADGPIGEPLTTEDEAGESESTSPA